MLIGVPKEIKVYEYRVGLTPDSVREFVAHGHGVVVETGAGAGIGCTDDDYQAVGAGICATAREVFDRAEMIIKVKEPQAAERRLLKPEQILFTYLHLAPDPDQTRDLVDSGAVCVAYETVVDGTGGLPLLAPMSQVAGRLSIQAGSPCAGTGAWRQRRPARRRSRRRAGQGRRHRRRRGRRERHHDGPRHGRRRHRAR